MVDADSTTVDERHRLFNNDLNKDGQADRADNESILLTVPKRNIQTWVLYMNGETVDETTRCRETYVASEYKAAAQEFASWFQNDATLDDALDSIKKGIAELKRLPDRS